MSKISIMERKSFEKLIKTRMDTLLNALNGNLLSNKEDLIRDALLSHGHQRNSDELCEEINKVDKKITDIVSEHLETERSAFDVKVSNAQETVDEKIRTLKEKYNLDFEVLRLEKNQIKMILMKEHESFEAKVAADKCPELCFQKSTLEKEKEIVEKIENIVDLEIKEKVNMIRKMKFRIENGIREKTNKALEGLLAAEEREEATALLESVPTVTELIVACQNMGGINDMINKMSPKLALPMPDTMREKIAEVTKTIDVQVTEVKDDEDKLTDIPEVEVVEANVSN